MPNDASPVLQALGAVVLPIPVRSLDRVCEALFSTGLLEADQAHDRVYITHAIGVSLRSGWVHTDGVRIALSSSGRRVVEDERLWPDDAVREAVARLGPL